MSYKTGTVQFHLKDGIKFTPQGQETQEFNMLSLEEYGPSHSPYYHDVSDMLGSLMMDMNKMNEGRPQKQGKPIVDKTEKEHEEDSEKLSEMLIMLVQISKSVRSRDFIASVKELICLDGRELAFIDGKHKLTSFEFDRLSPRDQLRLAANYCSFFSIGFLSEMKGG